MKEINVQSENVLIDDINKYSANSIYSNIIRSRVTTFSTAYTILFNLKGLNSLLVSPHV